MACNMLPSFTAAFLLVFLSPSCSLSQNDFKQVRIRDAVVVVVVQVHSKSDYVCLCTCVMCECLCVCVSVWVCICICKIFSAAATTTATAARRPASAEKWQTESHVAFAFNLLIALHCSLSHSDNLALSSPLPASLPCIVALFGALCKLTVGSYQCQHAATLTLTQMLTATATATLTDR